MKNEIKNGVNIVEPHLNFRGLSYGNWAVTWCNWLLSENPDDYEGGVLFLRGNVNYGPIGGVKGAPLHLDPKAYYDRTGDMGETIFAGTPIFFPILNAITCEGDIFDGTIVKSEHNMRYAAYKDITESEKMWATIRNPVQGPAKPLVMNINDFLIESPLFVLTVPKKSALRKKLENSMKPGTYLSITVGYYILVEFSLPSTYRLEFGGYGRGSYHTDARYDIRVISRFHNN
jgi:hypothetical protein